MPTRADAAIPSLNPSPVPSTHPHPPPPPPSLPPHPPSFPQRLDPVIPATPTTRPPHTSVTSLPLPHASARASAAHAPPGPAADFLFLIMALAMARHRGSGGPALSLLSSEREKIPRCCCYPPVVNALHAHCSLPSVLRYSFSLLFVYATTSNATKTTTIDNWRRRRSTEVLVYRTSPPGLTNGSPSPFHSTPYTQRPPGPFLVSVPPALARGWSIRSSLLWSVCMYAVRAGQRIYLRASNRLQGRAPGVVTAHYMRLCVQARGCAGLLRSREGLSDPIQPFVLLRGTSRPSIERDERADGQTMVSSVVERDTQSRPHGVASHYYYSMLYQSMTAPRVLQPNPTARRLTSTLRLARVASQLHTCMF